MGRNPRPTAARHRLIAALAPVLLAAGCGGHSNVQFSSSGSPSTGVSSGGSVSVQGGGSTFGTVLAIGMIGAIAYSESSNYGIRYRANPFDAIQSGPLPPPPLDPSRRVIEADCTKPIEDWSANLRCR